MIDYLQSNIGDMAAFVKAESHICMLLTVECGNMPYESGEQAGDPALE
jgi:hypothetical protein